MVTLYHHGGYQVLGDRKVVRRLARKVGRPSVPFRAVLVAFFVFASSKTYAFPLEPLFFMTPNANQCQPRSLFGSSTITLFSMESTARLGRDRRFPAPGGYQHPAPRNDTDFVSPSRTKPRPTRSRLSPRTPQSTLHTSSRFALLPARRKGSVQACVSPFCRDPDCVTPSVGGMILGAFAPSPSSRREVSSFDEYSSDSASTSGTDVSLPPMDQVIFFQRQQQPDPDLPSWKDSLLKVSNYASAFCILDCTVLPIITLLLPLVSAVAGVGGSGSHMASALHDFGHAVALWFVLPIGTMTTITNYTLSHRKLWISSLAVVGLSLILMANLPCTVTHSIEQWFPGTMGQTAHQLLHLVHHGMLHRATNLTGCFLLIGSNLLSKRFGKKCTNENCYC